MIKKERLDKILANMGYGSRKDVKKLIKEGRVEIDGNIQHRNDIKLDPYNANIRIDNRTVIYRKYIYLMMNKPKGVVSSTEDPMNRTILDLLDEKDLVFKPFPAGRLDKDTEGLLLLTNDGKLAHEILSPKKGIGKTYYAEINGLIDENHVVEFKKGLILDDGYKTLPSNLEILESGNYSRIKITIHEGKFHQIKRMFETFGMRVMYLKRISMGKLELDKDLGLGEYRELDEREIKLLKENNRSL